MEGCRVSRERGVFIASVEERGTKSEREREREDGRASKKWRFKLSQHAECSINRKGGIDGEKRGRDGVEVAEQ